RTGRWTTCATPTAIAATAVATCTPSGENVPTDRTVPVTWIRAVTIEVTINTANAIAVPRPARRRARPRLAIVRFQGASATMARPRIPWAITIHRTKAESTNHDATPVTKATTSSTSSARFVRRPATTRSCHRTGGRAADPIPVAREMAPRDPRRIDSARTTSNISGRGPDVVHRHRTRAADTAARSAAVRSGTAAAHRATL